MFLFLYRWLRPRELCPHPQIEYPPAPRAAYDADLCGLFEFVLSEIRPRSIWLARRMANGPNRDPGRFVVAPSHAIPATTVPASGRSARGGALKKPGLLVEVR